MITRISKALAEKRANLNKDDKGFTLIELLVVVLIIGILSAIAIPIFLGQQDAAKEAASKADLSTGKTAYVSYLTTTPGGTATSSTDATLVKNGFPSSLTIKTGGSSFCLENTAAPVWHISSALNAPVTGGC